jgi:5-methylcytosine-specific restriction endonuclease McrA
LSTRRISARPWNRVKAQVLAASRTCWLCGHEGATYVDHVIPRDIAPDLEFDITNLRPAHGAFGRCPTCNRACNEEKGAKLTWATPTRSRAW